jgi:hypothetical protein
MAQGRYGAPVTLLPDGRVLIVGSLLLGVPEDGREAELYDPGAGTWIVATNMTMPRRGHSATLLADGTVLVAGGDPPAGDDRSAELFDRGGN